MYRWKNSFLVNDTTFASNNLLRFRKKLFGIYLEIRVEKLQYDINRKAAKISALSSGKIHKYEDLTGEDILPSNQQQIIEQTKFTDSSLGKAFEKQIKTIDNQGKKQVDALENLKLKKKTKLIKDKINNQSRAAIIFNSPIKKRKK